MYKKHFVPILSQKSGADNFSWDGGVEGCDAEAMLSDEPGLAACRRRTE